MSCADIVFLPAFVYKNMSFLALWLTAYFATVQLLSHFVQILKTYCNFNLISPEKSNLNLKPNKGWVL